MANIKALPILTDGQGNLTIEEERDGYYSVGFS